MCVSSVLSFSSYLSVEAHLRVRPTMKYEMQTVR